MKQITVLALLSLLTFTQCAKILGVFPMSAHSHFTVGFTLMKELAQRGHEVTLISPYPQKTPIKNLKDIDISSVIKPFADEFKVHLQHLDKMYLLEAIPFYYSMGYTLVNDTLKHKNVQKLLNSNEKFDIVVMEQFFDEALTYFAYHFNAPLLLVSSIGPSAWTNHYFRNPTPYSHVPYIFMPNGGKMSFLDRAKNLFITLYDEFYTTFVVFPKQNEILHKYFPEAPHLNELMKQVSVILLNSHPSYGEPVATMPNLIEVGGYHVQPTGKLPKDVQEFLDDATEEGVVYFCLGSNLKPSEFSNDKVNMFVKVLSQLKQKVLWKFEADSLPNQPKNIKLIKWAPQQDILAHKNVKLFISHAGLLGTIEAAYFGVPVIGIPFFGDQFHNIETAVIKGHAISLPNSELSEEKLTAALKEILNNPKYMKVAKQLSAAMHDRIVKPMDEAVYWVEYVMRHPETNYFKSAAMELNWIQYHMLDVVFIFGLIAILLYSYAYKKPTKKHRKKKHD